jgi:hypothetical protein
VRHHIGMLCLQSRTVMVRMLDTFRGLYGPCSWHWCPEAASQELVPLVCACDHLREANDRSYLMHLSRGQGYHTEVDIRGRHERGCTRSFGAAMT